MRRRRGLTVQPPQSQNAKMLEQRCDECNNTRPKAIPKPTFNKISVQTHGAEHNDHVFAVNSAHAKHYDE